MSAWYWAIGGVVVVLGVLGGVYSYWMHDPSPIPQDQSLDEWR